MKMDGIYRQGDKVIIPKAAIDDRLNLIEKAIREDGAPDRVVAAESLLGMMRMVVDGKLVIEY